MDISAEETLRSVKYRNWVKSGLGLKYLKEGIQPFVTDVIKHQHEKFVEGLRPCSSCSLETLLPHHAMKVGRRCNLGRKKCLCIGNKHTIRDRCQLNVCGLIYDKIVSSHFFDDPNFRNTDITQWVTNPWEIAKCYIPAWGYKKVTSAEDTDSVGLLSIIINDLEFALHINARTRDTILKVREYRNSIMHSSDLEVTDANLNMYIKDMVGILDDLIVLREKKYALEARTKLQKLLGNEDFISTESEISIIREAQRSLEERYTAQADSLLKIVQNLEEIETRPSPLDGINLVRNAVDGIINTIGDKEMSVPIIQHIKTLLESMRAEATENKHQHIMIFEDSIKQVEEVQQRMMQKKDDSRHKQKLEYLERKIRQEKAAMLAVHEDYITFIRLLLRVGTDLLREITKKALERKNETLDQFLFSTRYAILNDKKLTLIQKNTLYPPSPQVPSLEDLDITSMSHLLNNYLIQYIDKIEVYAVTDIQDMINNARAHVTDAKMDTQTFWEQWNKLTTIIRSGSAGMAPDVQKKLTDMKMHITKIPIDITEALEEIRKCDQSRDFYERIQQSLESNQKGLKQRSVKVVKVANEEATVQNTDDAFATIGTSSGSVPKSPYTELSINLTDEGDLPHTDEFKHVSRKRRCSDSFKDKCRSVCRSIQKTSKEIKAVWPAYKYSKHEAPEKYKDIVFIFITNNGEENLTAFNYNIYQRAEKMCSNNESEIINKLECELEISDQDLEQIEQIENCIAQHSDELIKSHRNLTMIIPSFFKSKKFGSQEAEIQPTPCLVLCTQIKGFIPLSEEPFPEEIDGFPVDVREDTFTFSHGPSVYHQSIKMGCEIGSDKLDAERNPHSGTLGGFVEHNVHGPCCFTCAHVIFPDLTQLADSLIWVEDGERISVFQPSLVTNKYGDAFGRVVKAVFDGVAGVEAALIKIENREPTSGEFPHSSSETIFSHDEPMIYSSGRICHRSNLKRYTVVYKFGASTNITRGVLQVYRGVVVSEIPEIREHIDGDIKFSLRDQLFICNVDESVFSASGDSGALVFVEEEDKTLIAIGMVEGTTNSKKSVASPIHKIIEALDLKPQELKRF